MLFEKITRYAPLNFEQRTHIADMVRQGFTSSEIRERTGVSKDTVTSIRKEMGITSNAGCLVVPTADEVDWMKRNVGRFTPTQIGRHFGRSYTWAVRVLRDLDILHLAHNGKRLLQPSEPTQPTGPTLSRTLSSIERQPVFVRPDRHGITLRYLPSVDGA